jgi:putative permease
MIEASSHQMIAKERWVKLATFVLMLVALFLVITLVQSMFVSFLLAFVTYYMLAPVVSWIEGRGISRVWATTIPFLVFILIAGIATAILWPTLSAQLQSLKENFPTYAEKSTLLVENLQGSLNRALDGFYTIDFNSQILPKFSSMGSDLVRNLPDILSQSITIGFMVPLLAFFMLLDGNDFVRKLLSFVPNQHFELALNLNHQVSSQMGGFVRARFLESIAVAVIIWLGLFLMDFPYAILIAVFAAILNIIPYVGPVIGLVPPMLISMANHGAGPELLWLVVIFVVAQVIDTVLLVPFLVAKIVNLHPVTVVVAIMVGAQLMGILGMIICIPVVSTLKVSLFAIYKHIIDFRE